MDVTPVLIVATIFVTVAWVISTIVDAIRRNHQVRSAADFRGKLLDKIGSAREFGEFLSSDGGAKFLDSMTVETEAGPHVRILRSLQAGIVLLVLGAGLFILMGNRDLPFGAEDGMAMFGTITTAIGAGLLLATGATYVMSKRMGLMNGPRSHSGRPGDLT